MFLQVFGWLDQEEVKSYEKSFKISFHDFIFVGENFAYLLLVPPVGTESEKCPEVAVQASNWYYLNSSGEWSTNDDTLKMICVSNS